MSPLLLLVVSAAAIVKSAEAIAVPDQSWRPAFVVPASLNPQPSSPQGTSSVPLATDFPGTCYFPSCWGSPTCETINKLEMGAVVNNDDYEWATDPVDDWSPPSAEEIEALSDYNNRRNGLNKIGSYTIQDEDGNDIHGTYYVDCKQRDCKYYNVDPGDPATWPYPRLLPICYFDCPYQWNEYGMHSSACDDCSCLEPSAVSLVAARQAGTCSLCDSASLDAEFDDIIEDYQFPYVTNEHPGHIDGYAGCRAFFPPPYSLDRSSPAGMVMLETASKIESKQKKTEDKTAAETDDPKLPQGRGLLRGRPSGDSEEEKEHSADAVEAPVRRRRRRRLPSTVGGPGPGGGGGDHPTLHHDNGVGFQFPIYRDPGDVLSNPGGQITVNAEGAYLYIPARVELGNIDRGLIPNIDGLDRNTRLAVMTLMTSLTRFEGVYIPVVVANVANAYDGGPGRAQVLYDTGDSSGPYHAAVYDAGGNRQRTREATFYIPWGSFVDASRPFFIRPTEATLGNVNPFEMESGTVQYTVVQVSARGLEAALERAAIDGNPLEAMRLSRQPAPERLPPVPHSIGGGGTDSEASDQEEGGADTPRPQTSRVSAGRRCLFRRLRNPFGRRDEE